MESSSISHRSSTRLLCKRTLLTQAALCLALYGAFSIGRPQERSHMSRSRGLIRVESLDLYFLSVRGGFWPADDQSQLLRQMGKAAVFHKPKFVVNIAELGEDDPLMKNATLHLPILNVPWYTAATLPRTKKHFLKEIKIANNQSLDIVVLDTGLLQAKESASDELNWVQWILSVSDSKWRMVVGFHPLLTCQKNHTRNSVEVYEPLHQMFLQYGVNAYLSQQSCAGQRYSIEGIAYLGNPGPVEQREEPPSENGSTNPVIGRSGFLLHRVTPLEIESYFINLEGRVVYTSKVQQHGGVE
ncbi:hypothetical protein HPP92_016901 [Vanilla planifolia]|uniref:Calcineurin-like phosphoesterase domain-containing protein n=1 Tax=Vanilla planifolia TaxID=51239 RepID=A0A835QFN0_VANPL|nr:hypothetical protein HPP92_017493 [Vanilla planifolia]KAG0472355.1 hypothetical protein HPP92_016901 [Vanilla planifolia]